MSADVDSMFATVGAIVEDTTIVTIAVNRRARDMGSLEQIGSVIAKLTEGIAEVPGSRVFRTLWTQVLALLPRDASSHLEQRIQRILTSAVCAELEVRAVGINVAGPRGVEWLDDFLGQLTAPHNFRTLKDPGAWWIIDGVLL